MTYATLLHGEPDEVMEILDRGDADMAGLGMALCNAMRRISWLEAAARTRPPPADAPADPPRALLLEALDLVPRMSDDDPMAPALADWCGRVRAALSESG